MLPLMSLSIPYSIDHRQRLLCQVPIQRQHVSIFRLQLQVQSQVRQALLVEVKHAVRLRSLLHDRRLILVPRQNIVTHILI